MTLKLRALTAADFAEWSDLWAQYNAFYGRAGDTALHADVVACTWARLLDRSEPVEGLVAQLDRRLVGLAHVVFHRNLIQIAETCYLQDLFTMPETRGQGVAQALLDGVQDMCQERGVGDMYWHTHNSNAAARRLYDKLAQDTGFVVYRTQVT